MKTPDPPLRLSVLDERLAVCRLDAASDIPSWAASNGFTTFTRTKDELSVVCSEGDIPEGVACEKGWRILELEGPLDFSLIGILAGITGILAEEDVSVFVISTYDTDYVLVREEALERATSALRRSGHEVREANTNVVVRVATADDEPFLWEMLAEAAQEPAVRNVMANSVTARYVEGWGREGDLGLIAVSEDGRRTGAAWLRLLTDKNRGYGYVDDETPELAIAVSPGFRGTGIGTRLLAQLFERARNLYRTVCLSVRVDNPALHLYEKIGFDRVQGSESTNHVEGSSITMRRSLS